MDVNSLTSSRLDARHERCSDNFWAEPGSVSPAWPGCPRDRSGPSRTSCCGRCCLGAAGETGNREEPSKFCSLLCYALLPSALLLLHVLSHLSPVTTAFSSAKALLAGPEAPRWDRRRGRSSTSISDQPEQPRPLHPSLGAASEGMRGRHSELGVFPVIPELLGVEGPFDAPPVTQEDDLDCWAAPQ